MKKILIIDDFVKGNLEMIGDFEVTVCSDSKEGIELAKKLQPQLILLDIMMPEMNGPDIAIEIKNNKETKDIPIVFLTALIREQETKEKDNFIGGEYFISKPVKIFELKSMINTLLM